MSVPYTRAPHQGGFVKAGPDSLHAALLIDFDNVTMGMRSDLSKELKTLLDSDVIKGKVSVQRAYADWRRYPQYIVPLSEASVDLIFAPAYGSNKKNATDIRMAIDALELVFIRPEIGTYILLTGDSDFSSLVLKLKEYGKYVIGVGIQESSSDILVQNCDEYYSYTSLTGLTKTTELSANARDPWVLVRDAVAKMVSREDVMRSDRLKQVMQELDATFDEGSLGFSKFSKFLAEASSRGLVQLRKLDNGQYEVGPARAGARRGSDEGRGRRDRDRARGGRRERRERSGVREQPAQGGPPDEEPASGGEEEPASGGDESGSDPLREAYDLLTDALESLRASGREPVRDSDVKRKMLEHRRNFDEAELGFPKFSKFLAQAADHGVIRMLRTQSGNLEVSLGGGSAPSRAEERRPSARDDRAEARPSEAEPVVEDRAGQDGPEPGAHVPERDRAGAAQASAAHEAPAGSAAGPTVIEVHPPDPGRTGLRLGPRRGSTRRRRDEEPPPLLEGQTPEDASGVTPTPTPTVRETAGAGLEGLGLPTEPGSIVRYLTHRYRGVGQKTAETLVERFGAGVFATMHDNPEAIARAVPRRADQVLDAWRSDYQRRSGGGDGPKGGSGGSSSGSRGRS